MKIWMFVLLAGCGSKGTDPKDKWLAAKWTPTEGDLAGTHFTVDVPAGLPANTGYMLGKDWWVGTNADATDFAAHVGPRLTIDQPREKAFADAEALARDVEPDAKRSDLVEIAKEKLADGRLRYASAVKGNRHIDVTVWIPLDATRGVRCNAHWYAGSDKEPKQPPPPDPAIVAWLDHFCASLKLGG